jgi:hypothetical protein
VSRQNSVPTVRLQVSVDGTTDGVLKQMVPIGLHGKNKSEVASWILREWIWHNQEDLGRVGVRIASEAQSERPARANQRDSKTRK